MAKEVWVIRDDGVELLLNDAADVDRARVLYDKGTDRQAFFMGQVDKYSWRDVGSSFGLSEVLAAYLYAQLERREQILAKPLDVALTSRSIRYRQPSSVTSNAAGASPATRRAGAPSPLRGRRCS